MDFSPPQAEQFILYEGDGVEVFFNDGGRLQLSPCGTTFIYQQMSPLAAASAVQQRTQFATSSYRQRVQDAIDFRNRFAQAPFLCQELIEPQCLIRSPVDVFEFAWPSDVRSANIQVLGDGSVKLSAVTSLSNQPVAEIWLSATQRTFIVRYLVKMRNTMQNSRPQNVSQFSQQPTCQKESVASSSQASAVAQTRRVNPTSLESLRRVISFEPDDSCKPASENNRTQDVDITSGVPSMEYTFVSQHHSVLFYPSCWSQPVQLLLQFRNSNAFLSHLNGLRKSEAFRVSKESSCDKSNLVLLPLPEAMPLRCPAPHLHRWNPSASSDVCDYFHDKVRVVAVRGTIYRLLWDCNPRTIEVYPPDGSAIVSTGDSGHHFTHYFFSQRSQQIEERTYSSLNPPPVSVDLTYSVSRLVVMAHRLFSLMSDKYLDLATNRPVCWQDTSASPVCKSIAVTSDCVIDQCCVPGVGRFTAYLNGSIHVAFEDRTCLDMHGVHWESHIYRKQLHAASSDEDVEKFMSEFKTQQRLVSRDFPDDVCRLLLPSGHYQHVDILKPHPLYERYVSLALEYAMWVNTPPLQRKSFYCDSLAEQRNVADIELKKIRCFTYVLDRVLESSESKRESFSADTAPLSSAASGTGAGTRPSTLPNDSSLTDAQSVAKRALNRSAELLKDLDSFLLANERKAS